MVTKKKSMNQNLKPQIKQQTEEIRSIKSYLLIIIVGFVVLALIVGGVIYFVGQDEEPAPAAAPQIIVQPERTVEVPIVQDLPESEEPASVSKTTETPIIEPEPEPVSEVIQLDESSIELKQGETKEGIVTLKNTASVSTEMEYKVSFTNAPAELATQLRIIKEWFVEIPNPKKLLAGKSWDAPYKLVIPEDAALGEYEATFEVDCDSAQCGNEETAILKMKVVVV